MWSSFVCSTIRNFSEDRVLCIGHFQKIQLELIYFPYVVRKKMKSRHKLSKKCNIHGKNREIFGPYNFWTPVKRNIPDVWNWNCWTLFCLEIEVEAWLPWHRPPSPSGYAPVRGVFRPSRTSKFDLFVKIVDGF